MNNRLAAFLLLLALASCDSLGEFDFSFFNGGQSVVDVVLYEDVTSTHLPPGLGGASMDARFVDVDNDGDLDIIIACENCRNILLINDGSGHFTDESDERLPNNTRDSEDIGIADFDGNGWLDIVIVSEDDQINELYLNQGNGYFIDASDRIPVTGISNAVWVEDINGDGFPDIIIGNSGAKALLINDGTAHFVNEASTRLPPNLFGVTQDLAMADIDNDGDLDLLMSNEQRDWLLINDGNGYFTDESHRLQHLEGLERTREGEFGDVNGDGFMDIIFANERYSGGNDLPRTNRLLINDQNGYFRDVTGVQFPFDNDNSFEGVFFDIDGDGDLDILTGNCNIFGNAAPVPYGVYLNNGFGFFTRLQSGILPASAVGCGFAIRAADLNGDGIPDLFFANRNAPDLLLFGKAP